MAEFVKDGGAVFFDKNGTRWGIPKNAWVIPHPTLSTHIVISDKPVFDGRTGLVVAQAEVTAPVSSSVNELITKLHRDFFLNAVGGAVNWADVQGKPTSFPPTAHNHTKADITDFAHTHGIGEVSGLQGALSDKPQSSLLYSGVRFDQQNFWECLYQTQNAVAVNATSMTSGTISYIPLLVDKTIMLTEWSMRVVTGGSAGSVFVLGIIAARAGAYPLLGNVVYNSTPQSCATNNTDVVVTGLNVTLTAGLYWLAVQTNSTNSVTFLGVPLTATKPVLYLPAPNSTEYVTRVTVTQAYSATYAANQGSTNWINGAGFTPFRVLFKTNKTLPV